MERPAYKRVLLKISGEALAGDAGRGLNFDFIGQVARVIKKCVDQGVQVGVVVGGGNFWRGLKDGGDRMERTRADHMGMLATAINALAVADVLEQNGVDVRVQTAIEMKAVAEPYIRSRAARAIPSSPPTPPPSSGPPRSTPTSSCWPRTSTGSTPPTPGRTPPPSSSTPSPTARCLPGGSRSWTPPPPACPWTTRSPSSSSPWPTRRTSTGPSWGRRSAPSSGGSELPHLRGRTLPHSQQGKEGILCRSLMLSSMRR